LKTVIITGGTGDIGKSLTLLLKEMGYRVIVFSRTAKRKMKAGEMIVYRHWDPERFEFDKESIGEADAIVNLAGAGIADKRWTKERKRVIYDSRINSDKTIVKALEQVPNKIQVVVNASAIGYYGRSDGKRILSESDLPGSDFLSKVCFDWEEEIKPVINMGKRLVILRTGMVLDSNTGGYPKMTQSLKFKIGAVPGKGSEMISWIHINDLCRVYLEAIENELLSGIYNACAPETVSGIKFIRETGRIKTGGKFVLVRVPAALLRIILGMVVDEAILQNAQVSCEKLQRTGFKFLFNTIEAAVANLEG
jgi:uncharacterized protein (TIGR01777 family)